MSSRSEPRSDRSILAALEARGAGAEPVVLRALPGTRTPASLTHAERSEGRFTIFEEIARGGVGVVVRGRDSDLGRDVAIKLLRPRHAGNADLVRRFIEEAQVGGQLQHPGIVPIYELGLQADGVPFFAMKLVKGETLAEKLEARIDATENRHRFLTVFLRICQTMAYTHSRGVIHRDLKPANVMIGPFGEVQVVDWGFAKVLAHGGVADERRVHEARRAERTLVETVRTSEESTHSTAGAVLGTPAYMPPEQARGSVADLDERSDVFSLGAILTEILTGRPPFSPDTLTGLRQAREGDLTDVLERLDRCEGAGGLVELARRCLAPERSSRPANAERVAAEVGRYLTAAEERARRARLDAIDCRERASEASALAVEERAEAERARAAAERDRAEAQNARRRADHAMRSAEVARRARRQTIAIAAAVLLAVLVGGGAWLHRSAGLSARMRAAAGKIDAALARAERHARTEDWAESHSAILAAEALVKSEGADPVTTARVKEVHTRIDEGNSYALRQVRDREFLDRILDLRYRSIEVKDQDKFDAELRRVIESFDYPVEEKDRVFENVAAGESEFVVYFMQQSILVPHGMDAREVQVDLPALADLEKERERLLREGGFGRLLEVARSEEMLPPDTSVFFANTLRGAGETELARNLLERAVREYPDYALVRLSLAETLIESDPPENSRALRQLDAAVALRPRQPWLRVERSLVLGYLGHHEEALIDLRTALDIDPDNEWAIANLGPTLLELGRIDEGLAACRIALRQDPDSHAGHSNLADAMFRTGDLDGAIASARRAIELAPGAADTIALLAQYLAERDELDEALELSAQAVDIADRDHWNRRDRILVARADVLHRSERHDAAVAAYRRAFELEPVQSSGVHRNLGESLIRTGERTKGLVELREAVALDPDDPLARSKLGYALLEAGNADGASVHFRVALDRAPEVADSHYDLGNGLSGQGRHAEAAQAFREAIRIDPGMATAHLNLGNELVRLERPEEAADAYRRAIEADPSNAAAHAYLGNRLRNGGEREKALAKYRLAIDLEPKEPEWQNLRAGVLVGLGRLAEAADAYRAILPIDPENPRVLYNLANVVRDLGRTEEAVALFEAALELNPEFVEAHVNLGNVLSALGNQDAAIARYRVAIAVDREKAPAYAFANALSNLANELANRGQTDEALRLYREAIETDATHVNAHVGVGNMLMDLGRVDEAAGWFRKVTVLVREDESPRAYAHAWTGLAWVHMAKGDPEGALAHTARALELFPDMVHGLLFKGEALRALGRPAAAVVTLRRATALAPERPDILLTLSICLFAIGDLDEATDAARRSAVSGMPPAWWWLGVCLAEADDLAGAIRAQREALRLMPGFPEAMLNLGFHLAKTGEFEQALRSIRPALRMGEQRGNWAWDREKVLEEYEAYARQDRRLAAILDEREEIDGERSALARVAATRGRPAFATRVLAGNDLSGDPGDDSLYSAACYAIRTAAGDGVDTVDVPEAEHPRWRRRALEWMRRSALLWHARLEDPADRLNALLEIQHAQRDADLAPARDEVRLAKLPPEEREAWRILWSDLEKARAAATR